MRNVNKVYGFLRETGNIAGNKLLSVGLWFLDVCIFLMARLEIGNLHMRNSAYVQVCRISYTYTYLYR